MEPRVLRGRSFAIEFDFYDVQTDGIEGEVVNVHPGKDPDSERQLGLHPQLARVAGAE